MSEAFEQFWKVYPRRAGTNSKYAARTKFERAVARGTKPEDIIAGAKAYASDPTTKAGTEFVAMAVTWLNQRRWEDYQAKNSQGPMSPTRAPEKPTHGLPCPYDPKSIWLMSDTAEWTAWKIVNGRSKPTDRHGGWVFPSRWPPDFDIESPVLPNSSDGPVNTSQAAGSV